MNILMWIWLVWIIVGYIIYKKYRIGRENLIREILYMETSSIAEAKKIVDDLTKYSEEARHYVELKGVLTGAGCISAIGREKVLYSKSRVSEVIEKKTRDSKGNTKTSTYENDLGTKEIYSSYAELMDKTGKEVMVGMSSFGYDMDTKKTINENRLRSLSEYTEKSEFVKESLKNKARLRMNEKRLGYNLREEVYPINNKCYCLGEMGKDSKGVYDLGGSEVTQDKTKKLTFYEEDKLVENERDAIWRARLWYILSIPGYWVLIATLIYMALE